MARVAQARRKNWRRDRRARKGRRRRWRRRAVGVVAAAGAALGSLGGRDASAGAMDGWAVNTGRLGRGNFREACRARLGGRRESWRRWVVRRRVKEAPFGGVLLLTGALARGGTADSYLFRAPGWISRRTS